MVGTSNFISLLTLNFTVGSKTFLVCLALRDLKFFIEYNSREEFYYISIWNNGDRKYHSIICISLSDDHMEHVRESESAKYMWDTLTNIF